MADKYAITLYQVHHTGVHAHLGRLHSVDPWPGTAAEPAEVRTEELVVTFARQMTAGADPMLVYSGHEGYLMVLDARRGRIELVDSSGRTVAAGKIMARRDLPWPR